MKERLCLLLILLLGFIIRVWNLEQYPTGFFADEASIGYNAYTILSSGKDQYGMSFPFFFKSFGEYKDPVEIYSTVPLIYLFGLSQFSTRLTSAIWGTLGILAIFYLILEMFKDYPHKTQLASFGAIFLATSPWAIQFSRVSLEGLMPYLTFSILGTFFFLKINQSLKFLILSIICFSLAFYSYFPARIFIPFFVIGLLIFNSQIFIKNKPALLWGGLITGIFLTPFLLSIISNQAFSRWNQVSIFSNPPQNQPIIVHIINNYISNLSISFLFLKGDIGMTGQFITRHSVRGFGELYLFQAPLILLGIIFLVKKRLYYPSFILLLWTILFPSGSMLTTDRSVQATRSIIGIVPLQIFSALGLIYLLELIKIKKAKEYVLSLFLIIIFISLGLYLYVYFKIYPSYSANFWGWQYGPKPIMAYFLSHQNLYDDLYMSGEFNGSDIFLKFYDPISLCQNKCRIGDFLREPGIINKNKKQLFALSPDYLKKSAFGSKFDILKTILYPNKQTAFLIGILK